MPSHGAAKEMLKRPAEAKELRHLTIRKAENGGHMVEHYGSGESEMHVFGPGEGKAMMEHVGTAMGVSDMAKSGSPKGEIDA